MPETINKTDNRQIIGGVFSKREDADAAVKQLRELSIPNQDIQVVVMLDDKQADRAYTDALVGRGVTESQALFYDVLDANGAQHNPDGSRNMRDDVAGMTVGAAAGAVAGGVAGAAVAGPLGAAVGAAAGAVVGGGAGAAAGKAAEHSK
jgi:hypothetical protein